MGIIMKFALLAAASAVTLHQKQPKHYEPEWGLNSGNSYNNGPTDHFTHGLASPYPVTGESFAQKKYEPEWGLNSGNSYNNGPFTHFTHGLASPYASLVNPSLNTSQ